MSLTHTAAHRFTLAPIGEYLWSPSTWITDRGGPSTVRWRF